MGIISGMTESRATLENPSVSLSDPAALSLIFGDSFTSAAGVDVTTEKALGIPAVWAAVNFISKTVASLPLQVYRRTDTGREVSRGDFLYTILHDVVNEDAVTSFKWRTSQMIATLTNGRAFTYIERNKALRPKNLWPLDPSTVEVKRKDNRTTYEVKDGGRRITYAAGDILDFPFILSGDGLSHFSPVKSLKDALGLAMALERYASKFFQNGGVPPLALHGPKAGPGATQRAKAAVSDAIKRANDEGKNVLYLPLDHELKQIGYNPEQGQLIMAREFQLQEVARIYGMPPTFLQDLSHGTFSNTEQQDLHFVKHTLTHWLEMWEQELNAKLFVGSNRFAEFNVDGLLRGDFKSRMDGYATAVQNAIRTPDEVRGMENLPPAEGGDRLYLQGATVPITQAGEASVNTDQE